MTRSKGISIENNFIGGLNTEATALAFPSNSCTSTINCVFDETGRVLRRKEFDIETGASFSVDVPDASSNAYTEFLWTSAGGTGLINIHVVQDGATLHFYNVSSGTTVSTNKLAGTVDISSFEASGTTYNSAMVPCQYAIGNGDLLVTNKACDPFYIALNPLTLAISSNSIIIKYRDFLGLPVSYADSFRPTFSISTLKTDTVGALHFYNLLNQGWWQGAISGGSPDSNSALGQWDTARTDMPSNQDYVGYYRASPTDPFDNARVDANGQGNTLSPKGHFILNLGEADRRQSLVDAGYSLSFSSASSVELSGTTGTSFGGTFNIGVIANAFDSDTNTRVGNGEAGMVTIGDKTKTLLVGKDYGGSPKVVSYARVQPYISGSTGFFGYLLQNSTGTFYNVTTTFYLRGHSSAPVIGTEGTLLGTAAVTTLGITTPSDIFVNSSDLINTYRYVWIYAETTGTQGSTVQHTIVSSISTVTVYEYVSVVGSGDIPSTDVTSERPSTCAFYAGRAWYAGVDAKNIGSNLYYSQIIEKESQYGLCYQTNDPTSEEYNTLLPSDGGVIRIPEIAKIIKLYTQQSSLLVFATNGVWVVSGSGQGRPFEATDFTIKRISSLGTQSPFSFIDVKGLPVWWGEDGIFRLDYNPQFDSFSVVSESETKIQTLFLAINPLRRSYSKGAYDSRNDIAYWLYSDGDESSPLFQYNRVLVFNTRSKAFYTWEISSSTPKIVGVCNVSDSVGFSPSSIKYTTKIPIATYTKKISFSDTEKEVPTYTDWYDFSISPYGVTVDAIDYSSYFITGYKLDGETQKFFQSNYVMVFLETETNSGAYLQGIYDFTNSGNSGKWSSRQEVYNSVLQNRDINYRRLKVRGMGRALQLKITSKAGKPFNIIGWSIFETVNSDV